MKIITKEQALRALHELEETAFGHDKGSGDAYYEWACDQGLCEYCCEDEGEEWIADLHEPPGILELFVAIGILPQTLVDILHVNPNMFPVEMCKAYNVPYPKYL